MNHPPITKYINAEMRIDRDHVPVTDKLLLSRDDQVDIIGVYFKQSGKVYYFYPNGISCKVGDRVVVDTARGVELGTVGLANKSVLVRTLQLPLRNLLRLATPEDIRRSEENAKKRVEALKICREEIVRHKLEMKLVDVEYTFDNNKLLVYFTADGRVDFRELVKDLAGIFRMRIELRQIGIRDEAKMIGGLAVCGRPLCCGTFLSDFAQVSIKMAKQQNLSLNSAKISGTCGRLMCCLRFENEAYVEEEKKTPKVDALVQTPDGEGYVIETTPLAGLIKVRFIGEKRDNAPRVYHRDDVTVLKAKYDRNSDRADARASAPRRAAAPTAAPTATAAQPVNAASEQGTSAGNMPSEVTSSATEPTNPSAPNNPDTPSQGNAQRPRQNNRRNRPRRSPNRPQNGDASPEGRPQPNADGQQNAGGQQNKNRQNNNRRQNQNRPPRRDNGQNGPSANGGTSDAPRATIPGMKPRDSHTIPLIDGSASPKKPE